MENIEEDCSSAMTENIHAAVAYVVCRLITGRKIASLFDHDRSRRIDFDSFQDSDFLREFDDRHAGYIPGYARYSTYHYSSSSGITLHVHMNARTFIVHVSGSSAYFIGNVQRNTIHIYDHKASENYNYTIEGFVSDKEARAIRS